VGVGGLGEDGREAWVVGEILRISGALEVAFSLEVVEEEEPVLRGGGAPPAKDLVRTFPRCLRMRTMGTASAAVVRPRRATGSHRGMGFCFFSSSPVGHNVDWWVLLLLGEGEDGILRIEHRTGDHSRSRQG